MKQKKLKFQLTKKYFGGGQYETKQKTSRGGALIVALSMILSLSACSSDSDDDDTSTNNNNNNNNTTQTDTNKPTDTKPTETTPTETVILDLDFTKLSALTEDALKDQVKEVEWWNVDDDFNSHNSWTLELVKGTGLKYTTKAEYACTLNLAVSSIDLTGAKCIVDWETEGWTYGDGEYNKRLAIKLISEKDSGNTPTKMSQGNFANESENITKGPTTIPISDFEYNQWDDDFGAHKDKDAAAADLGKIIGIQFNTQNGKGVVTIKSIKFVK